MRVIVEYSNMYWRRLSIVNLLVFLMYYSCIVIISIEWRPFAAICCLWSREKEEIYMH